MISGIELKRILYSSPNLIKDLLSSMGCQHIKKTRDRITSTRPNGDNKNSVNIFLTETLNVKVYTRTEFENRYEIQDIITLTQYFLDCSLFEATNYICKVCNIDNSGDYVRREENPTISFLRKYKRLVRNEEEIVDTPLDESVLNQFIHAPCKIFTDDNISILAQEYFEVGYDLLENRVIFPIRNEKGELVTVKGRTLAENYKLLGLPKYYVYYDTQTNHILYGSWQNKEELKKAEYILVFESEKSVMKCWQYGIYNCVAICKKSISKQQIRKLLSMGKPIVLCYDSDVSEKEIKIIARNFKNLIPVYYTLDTFGLLGEKTAPIDIDLETFNVLIENKIEYKE